MDTPSNIVPHVEQSQNITAEKLKNFLPKGCSARVTDEIVDEINKAGSSVDIDQNYFEERFMSSMHLLGKQGATVSQLVNAIKYCCLKQTPGITNEKAWAIVFPDRYDKLIKEGRFVHSHVSGYNSSDMVVAIDKSMLIPAHVTYQPYFHAAVKKQYDLMNGIGASEDDRVSAHVQHLAAKELAELTKMPEENNISLKVGMDDSSKSVYGEMISQLAQISKQQRIALEEGKNILEVQKLNINMDDIMDAQYEETNNG